MDDFHIVEQKLKAFIRKFYLNEVLKGISLFLALWLLYALIILFVEYLFWLNSFYRSILFWTFIFISAALFVRFIVFPVLQLFKLARGIGLLEASKMVGRYFPEVRDKLVNVLQLKNAQQQSELLLASISQKSRELSPVPFTRAVDLKSGLKYLKYALFPVIILLAVIFTGNFAQFSKSYQRVVHYNIAYAPPAPFRFILPAQHFKVEEGSDFLLKVSTEGKVIPENISINYEGEKYFLKQTSSNEFEYRFQKVKNPVYFKLEANGVRSSDYFIEVIKVPRLRDFKMFLNYPGYTGKTDEEISGTGNATVPEGTTVLWKLETEATQSISFSSGDTIMEFKRKGSQFELSKPLFFTTLYSVNTSNSEMKNYENLDYRIGVIKDQPPAIKMEMKKDSVDDIMYFKGSASDDYKIKNIRLVYYKEEKEEEKKFVTVPFEKASFCTFLASFPGELQLEKGQNYQLYFEVFDNDGIHGSKSTKSEIFDFRKKSDQELESDLTQKQGESISGMSKDFEKMNSSREEFSRFSEEEKQKENLDFNDRRKLKDFLKRQKAQEEMMRNYSEKLQKTLQKDGNSGNEDYKKQLQERLSRNEERLKENEKLLKELEEYSNKIDKEELGEKLENLAKNNSSQQKSLEQLLELTKRYYIDRKSEQLINNLQQLSTEQEKLAEQDSKDSKEAQDFQKELNKKFSDFQKELDDLKKENEGLKKPLELPRDKDAEESISQDQEKASEELEQENNKSAGEHQNSAAKKMKSLAQKMKTSRTMAQGQQLNIDIDSMRKILDNLLTFSFEQEDLLKDFRNMRINNPEYAARLKKQQVLKEHFEHINDSIFSLALKNPMISDKITESLTSIEYDLNKALERLSQNELPQGAASQQYVMTGTNELANMLDDVLSNMQKMESSAGGKGAGKKGIQLSDIIQSQEQLNSKMAKEIQDQKPGEQEGEKGEPKGSSEEENARLYEIYKEQQELRLQLQDRLQELGEKGKMPVLQEMEQAEKQLLEEGVTKQALNRMNRIKEQMLKMKDAVNSEGFENKRESRTNTKEYQNHAQDQIGKAKEYFNSTEILNRHILPLRQNYKIRVRNYFDKKND
ncbi:MAG: hypothetical protein WCD31_01520 [Gillisia sp.]